MEEEEKFQRKEAIRDYLLFFIIPTICLLILFRVLFRPIFIPSGSMTPTLEEGSFHLTWRLPYLRDDPMPERGKIVVFETESGRKYIKRVIGIGGDEIHISDGKVYLNGEKLEETYLPEGVQTDGDDVYRVPEKCIFVLGDNRGNSKDSRYMENPYIPAEQIFSSLIF